MVFRNDAGMPDVSPPSNDDLPACKFGIKKPTGSSCAFVGVYPSAYHNFLWREEDPLAAWNPLPDYGWVSQPSVLRGTEAVNFLESQARSKQPIGCTDLKQSCEAVVPYQSSKEGGPTGLALCLMSKTTNNLLIPRTCVPVLIRAMPEPIVLVVTAYRQTGYAPIDNSMFSVLIDQKPLGTMKSVADSLLNAIKSAPFDLVPGKYVVGAQGALLEASAGPRRSHFENERDFNEMLTVHADVLVLGDAHSNHYIGISTSVNVLVNKQNTEKSTDWHPIPWTEMDNYDKWVAQGILTKMTSYCAPHLVDFHTIVCR